MVEPREKLKAHWVLTWWLYVGVISLCLARRPAVRDLRVQALAPRLIPGGERAGAQPAARPSLWVSLSAGVQTVAACVSLITTLSLGFPPAMHHL